VGGRAGGAVTERDPKPSGDAPPAAACPWCGRRARELLRITSRRTRYFRCERCRRTFAVDMIISPSFRDAPDDDS